MLAIISVTALGYLGLGALYAWERRRRLIAKAQYDCARQDVEFYRKAALEYHKALAQAEETVMDAKSRGILFVEEK